MKAKWLEIKDVRATDPSASYQLTGGLKEPVIIRVTIREWSDLKPQKPVAGAKQ